MSDAADISSPNETAFIEDAIALHQRRNARPEAEYNEEGEKTCTECGNVIPTTRAAIEWVVTCIDCQTLEELIAKRGR